MIEYQDAYLRPYATAEREERATADVALDDPDSAFSLEITERLVATRVYIIACLECTTADGDAFAVKLSAYRREYNDLLKLARVQAAQSSDGDSPLFSSVELQRG